MKKIIKILPILVLLFMATVSVVKIYAYEKTYNEKMTIIYDNACVQIYEDEVSLLFNDKFISLQDYNVYFSKNDFCFNDSYYIFDVLQKIDEIDIITSVIVIYNENDKIFNKIHIEIFNVEENKYYNLETVLCDEYLSLLLDDYILIDDTLSDEILESLNTSLSIFSLLQKDLYNKNDINLSEKSNNINDNKNDIYFDEDCIISNDYFNLSENVSRTSSTSNNIGELDNINSSIYRYNSYNINYDSYTDDDGIIHSYVEEYFGSNVVQNGPITDDPIVTIIPKELCFQLGSHLYIGREYGFFINTTQDSEISNDFAVDIFVFDIANIRPNFNANNFEGFTAIYPLFQYKYRAVDKSRRNNLWEGFDSTLTRVVYPHRAYDTSNFAISNVSFKHTLENETGLNIGDQGYDPNSDLGGFFVQTRLVYHGIGLKRNNESYLNDTLSFGFGFFDKTQGALGYLIGLIENENLVEVHTSNNEENIQTYAPNRNYQIEHYENLLKQVCVIPNNSSDEPVIFKEGHYIESIYLINYYEEAVDTRYIDSISLQVGVDYSSKLMGIIGTGEFSIYESGSSYYGTSNLIKYNETFQSSARLNYNGDAYFYQIVPEYTGEYVIETTGNTNTYLHLYDSLGNQLMSNDNSGYNYNGRIKYNLIYGETYYVKVRGYNDQIVGDFIIKVMFNIYGVPVLGSDSYIETSIESSYQIKMYEIYISSNYTYEIFTEGDTSVDTQLYLYDSNMNLLLLNDDGGVALFSQLVYNFNGNSVYYLVVKCYANKVGTFYLGVREY